MIEFGREVCGDFKQASGREWLDSNGIGGYASSSISGTNTRRYHGLLVAATRSPLGRMVLLSKFEETFIVDGERFELSTNQYPRTVYPDGYKYLMRFRLDPFPIWTFVVKGVEFEKSLFMVHGENSTVIRWRLKGLTSSQVEIEIKPLLAFRDHHHLRQDEANFNGAFVSDAGVISMTPNAELPTLYFSHNAVAVAETGFWYRDLEYAIEIERGFDHSEDLFQPFSLKFDLENDAVVIASTRKVLVADVARLEEAEIARRGDLIETAAAKDDLTAQLALAADQFIVSRGEGKTVLAGYHWFSDWGRDTMIALPGLTLSTNRPEIAKSILREFAKHISEGMIPNRFPDAGEKPDYNTVDATLWFFEAIRAFVAKTGDDEFVRDELYEKLTDIIDWHIHGTRYRIHVDTDGLLFAGEDGENLTWMDAKIGGWVVTPRTGKAVEIQALWFNALCITADLAERFGDEERREQFVAMAAMAKDSFNGQFWNAAKSSLFDVVNDDQKDAAIRPNQIFAVSLHHSMLDAEKARKVVDKVEAELLTPVGLRSLSPNDPQYCPIYIGSPLERDSSYHQGTVWGWLIGHFVDAYRRVHSKDAKAEAFVEQIVEGFKMHLSEAMAGQISEIFDGDFPHLPRGCAAQAWSVAEVLRILKS